MDVEGHPFVTLEVVRTLGDVGRVLNTRRSTSAGELRRAAQGGAAATSLRTPETKGEMSRRRASAQRGDTLAEAGTNADVVRAKASVHDASWTPCESSSRPNRWPRAENKKQAREAMAERGARVPLLAPLAVVRGRSQATRRARDCGPAAVETASPSTVFASRIGEQLPRQTEALAARELMRRGGSK